MTELLLNPKVLAYLLGNGWAGSYLYPYLKQAG